MTLKLGVAFPLDNRLKDSISNTISSIGLEFGVGSNYGTYTESYVSLDYFGKNLSSFSSGSFVPVTYNVRFFRNRGDVVRRSYFLAGAGLGFANIGGSSETLVVGRAGVGMEVSDHTFFEAVGTVSASGNGGALNTLGIYFGYRF